MKKSRNYKSYTIILIILLIIVFFAYFFASRTNTSIDIRDNDYKTLNSGWYVLANNEKVYIDDLPTNIDSDNEGFSRIYIELPYDFSDRQDILVRSSLQDLTVYLDDEEIYTHLIKDAPAFMPMASLWHIIELHGDSSGRVLSIELSSPYDRFEGVINEIEYGTTGELFAYLFDTFGYRLILGLIIFIMALIILLVNQFMDSEHSNGRIYLATFVMLVSAWIMMESKLIQLIIPNQFVIGAVPYFLVGVMCIPIMLYIKDYVSIKFKKVFGFFAKYFSIQVIVVIVLQLLHIYDYFESALIVQMTILIVAIASVIMLFIEYYKYYSDVAKKFLNHFLIIVIFAISEIINFAVSDFAFTSIYGLVILTLYTLYLLIRYIIQINYRFKLSYKLEVLSQLVYIDALTGGKNRYAFEMDFEKDFNNPNINHQLRLVIFDFDNFKQINDSFGHVEGDDTLKLGLSLIHEVFGKYGLCYRIGGDEFACIMKTSNKQIYLDCQKSLEIALINSFKEKPYQLEISSGSSIYLENTFEKPSDMLRLADQNMYASKHTK